MTRNSGSRPREKERERKRRREKRRHREHYLCSLRDLSRYFSIKLLGTRRRVSPPSKLRHRRETRWRQRRLRGRGITSRDRSRATSSSSSPLSRCHLLPSYLSTREIFLETARKSSTTSKSRERANGEGARDFVFRPVFATRMRRVTPGERVSDAMSSYVAFSNNAVRLC